MNLDMIIVVAYGLILPEEVINLPKLGCFNVHASLLPRWRGAAPIQRAMIEGDQTTGVTIMKMDKGLDTGDIGLQKEIKIEQQNYSELEKELANEGAELLINFIDRLDGSIQFAKQNDTQACYAKKIQKQEALIDWTENAEKINRRINAYNPSPCAWFSLNNKRIKILKAEVIHEKGEAGKIMNEEFLIGCGINSINYVLGITKAYTTRVGEGPFPTELTDDIGELLGTRGKEFGTVTSRKRRCGWFDGVLVRQTIKVSGIDGIALTKLDVLDELDEIKMCVAYELDGKRLDYLPAAVEDQIKIKPIYETFPGWKVSTNGVKNLDSLPENAKKYIFAVEDFIGAKVSSISTSPERDDTILIENPFEV